MKQRLKIIPAFEDEDKERDFWATHDSMDYLNWKSAKAALFPNLKPTTRTISLRIPEHMLNRIKTLANQNDVPYQSFIKILLNQTLKKELAKTRA